MRPTGASTGWASLTSRKMVVRSLRSPEPVTCRVKTVSRAGAQHGPSVVDDLCWQFRPAEPPGDAVCADHRMAGNAAGAGDQDGRGTVIEVAQRAAEHRVACPHPRSVDVQAGPAGQTDVAGSVGPDVQPLEPIPSGRRPGHLPQPRVRQLREPLPYQLLPPGLAPRGPPGVIPAATAGATYLRIVLRSTPSEPDTSFSDLPACQCTSISVTSTAGELQDRRHSGDSNLGGLPGS
jgi:hypothetical protein